MGRLTEARKRKKVGASSPPADPGETRFKKEPEVGATEAVKVSEKELALAGREICPIGVDIDAKALVPPEPDLSGGDMGQRSVTGAGEFEGVMGNGGEAATATLPAFGYAQDLLAGANGRKDLEQQIEESKHRQQTREERVEGYETPAQSDAAVKYVTFTLGREEYGLPICQVQEINRIGEVTRVPNSPEHVLGVINLRGKILPVIEIKKKLHIGDSEITKESRVVVVEIGKKLLGLLVDKVSQVTSILPSQVEETPDEVVRIHDNYLTGVAKIEEKMIILLNLDKLLAKAQDKKA